MCVFLTDTDVIVALLIPFGYEKKRLAQDIE